MAEAEAKTDKQVDILAVWSILFLPASNPRAIAKAREAGSDLVVLDLEDAVKPEDKAAARSAAVDAVAERWPMPIAIRAVGMIRYMTTASAMLVAAVPTATRAGVRVSR